MIRSQQRANGWLNGLANTETLIGVAFKNGNYKKKKASLVHIWTWFCCLLESRAMVLSERRSRDKFAGAKLLWFHETDICFLSRSLSRFDSSVTLPKRLPFNFLLSRSLSHHDSSWWNSKPAQRSTVIRYYIFLILPSPRRDETHKRLRRSFENFRYYFIADLWPRTNSTFENIHQEEEEEEQS